MNTYETIYISPADIPQERIDTTLDKVKAIINRSNGKILTAELWGRRKLAYPIKRNRDGFYVYLLYSASADAPALLDRHFQVTDTILRGLTVKIKPKYLEKIRTPVRTAAAETPAASATASEPAPATEPAPAIADAAAPAPNAGSPSGI